jgi:hypothetical protein
MNPQKVDYNRMDEDNNMREKPQIRMGGISHHMDDDYWLQYCRR